jgi:hypothetical protein
MKKFYYENLLNNEKEKNLYLLHKSNHPRILLQHQCYPEIRLLFNLVS